MFNISANKPFVVTEDIRRYLEKGGGTLQNFSGLGVKQIEKVLAEYQKDYIRKNFGTGKKDALPKAANNIINKKLNTITNLMHAAAVSKIGQQTWRGKTYNISKTGIKFLQGQVTGGALGTFIQDISMFGGLLGAGRSEALPDMLSILTELKSYHTFDAGLHSGDITIGVEIRDESSAEIERAKKILDDNLAIEATTIIQLYLKMRNLLLIMPDFRGGETHFAAIILYIEIIIKKLMEMTKVYRNPKGEMVNLVDGKSSTVGPYIRIERSDVKEITKEDNRIIFQRGYSIDFINLYYAKQEGSGLAPKTDFYTKMENAFKNLESLYTYRRDILEYVKGNYEAAKDFFGVLTNEEMPFLNLIDLGINVSNV
jgi:hypothetical protein